MRNNYITSGTFIIYLKYCFQISAGTGHNFPSHLKVRIVFGACWNQKTLLVNKQTLLVDKNFQKNRFKSSNLTISCSQPTISYHLSQYLVVGATSHYGPSFLHPLLPSPRFSIMQSAPKSRGKSHFGLLPGPDRWRRPVFWSLYLAVFDAQLILFYSGCKYNCQKFAKFVHSIYVNVVSYSFCAQMAKNILVSSENPIFFAGAEIRIIINENYVIPY